MPLSGVLYCSVCDHSGTNDPCYGCLLIENKALQVALVEAKSEVTVASCLPKLDSDVPSIRRVKPGYYSFGGV